MIKPEIRLALLEGIKRTESGGHSDPYRAVGPKTEKGNRAYGAFQVMDFNIPNWTKECIGERLTVEEVLQDEEAQLFTAGCKIQQSYDRYGSIEDAFAVYFSGRPVKGNNSKDVTGTSVPTYVKKTLRHLGI